MAVNPLSLLASLRPWRSAGITHLLAGHDSSSLSAGAQAPDIASDISPDDPGAPDAPCPDNLSSGATAGGPPLAGPREAFAVSEAPRKEPLVAFPAGRADRSTNTLANGIPSCEASAEPWPDPWPQLLQKTRPAPLLWTYAELATDLLAPDTASTARSAVLRVLIRELGLPKGSSAFWPLFASGDATKEPAGATVPFCCSCYFLAGLVRLTPKVVVVFGARAAGDAPAAAPYTQGIVGGRAFVYLPSLSDLDDGAAQRRSGAFLRSILTQFPLFPERM